MAITETAPFTWPHNIYQSPDAVRFVTAQSLAASGDGVGMVFQAPRSGDITTVGFYVSTNTLDGNVDVRLETVDGSTALPTGTLVSTNSNVTYTITATGWQTATLASAATVTRGTQYAVVINWSSGTNIVAKVDRGGVYPGYTRVLTNAAGAGWAIASALSNYPAHAVGYDISGTVTYFPVQGTLPISSYNAGTTFNTGTSVTKIATRFQVPFDALVIGCEGFVWASAGGGAIVSVCNDSGTELSSSSTAINLGLQTQARGVYRFLLDNAVELTANTNYLLVVEAQNTTNLNYDSVVCPSTAVMGGLPGGANVHAATFTSPTWTADPTRRIFFHPILGGVGVATGGGRVGGFWGINAGSIRRSF